MRALIWSLIPRISGRSMVCEDMYKFIKISGVSALLDISEN